MSGRDATWEPAAARVLSSLTAADTIQEHDRPGGPPGRYDLEMTTADGRSIAVEVTRATDQQLRQLGAELGDGVFAAPDLDGSWVLEVEPHVQLNAVRSEAPRLLAQLQADGVVEVDARRGGLDVQRYRDGTFDEVGLASRSLLQLGIERALWIRSPKPGRFWVMWPVLAAWEDPDAVVEAIEQCADDNARKLRAANDLGERHLFVWLDDLRWAAAVGLQSGRSAEARPARLPDGVDVVWAAMWIGTDPPQLPVWKWDGRGWESLYVNPGVVRDVLVQSKNRDSSHGHRKAGQDSAATSRRGSRGLAR